MNKTYVLVFASVVWWNACATAMNAQAAAAAAADFSYSGDTGPGYWQEIHGDKYPACAPLSGNRQSPINIRAVEEDPELRPLDLNLTPAPFVLSNPGYTIQATPEFGSSLTLNGRIYSLLQFHFHTLSEHTVAGVRGAMELHVVFRYSDTDLAVVGVLYRIGRFNPFLQELIDAGLPQKTTSGPTTVQRLNLEKALTDTAQYFTYSGSLTTPPCSPYVNWIVLKQWSELSPEQFEAFRKILGNDFRPLQEKNERVVRATVRRGIFDEGAAPPAP